MTNSIRLKIWLVLLVIIFVFGCAQINELSDSQDYYEELADGCINKESESCCFASVEAMKAGNYMVVPQEGCPVGYQANSMRCIDSYRWCQSTKKISQATNNISSWKTYVNTKYDYQIKYPADWALEVDGVVAWHNQVPNPEFGKRIMFFGTKTEDYEQTANIRVFISPADNPNKLLPREWYIEQSKLHYSYGVEPEFENLEDTTFKGLPALKIKGELDEGYTFLIAKDILVYDLSFSFDKSGESEFDVSPEQIFQEMLDSLLLDQNQINDLNLNFFAGGSIFGSSFEVNLSNDHITYIETVQGGTKEVKNIERKLLPIEIDEIVGVIIGSNLLNVPSQNFTKELSLPDQAYYRIYINLDEKKNTILCSIPYTSTEASNECQKQIDKLRLALNKILGLKIY
ncbi:MAG: hypothetical protein AABX33_08655 [Nanoarchaeota archaeon]